MKKLILSSLAMASLAFAANAVTNMCVEQSDGTIVRYDVDKVKQVYYEESSDSTTDQGVTVSGKEGIYTYVDLGLVSGTKWATCNVGATKPTEYGDYFVWGETKPKEDYSWNTYKWCITNADGLYDKFTKYVNDSYYGTLDNKIVLEAEDDAATANWGSAWRMPTLVEIKELLNGCDWEWTENFNSTGVAGRVGTSKANGAKIFLPAAGSRNGTGFYSTGNFGCYWSSSLDKNGSYYAYDLYFFDSNINWGFDYRNGGQSVRAVLR